MKTPQRPAPELSHSGVRAADRLGFTLFVAALIHLAVILGVGFSMSEPKQISKTLEITLSTFKSATAPKKADFLAQDNQEGSGTLDKKAVPTTTQVAPFQDTEVKKVTPPPAAKPEQTQAAPKAAVTTVAPKLKKATSEPQKVKTEAAPKASIPTFDSSQLSSEISSLEAELANEQQQYAKRPKIYRMSAASTMRDKGAWYKEDWRKKIERIGNLNYPEQARREKSTAGCGCWCRSTATARCMKCWCLNLRASHCWIKPRSASCGWPRRLPLQRRPGRHRPPGNHPHLEIRPG